jgi:hypothetical protein
MSPSFGAIGATSAAPVQLYLDIPTPSWQGVGNGKPVPVDFEVGRFAVDENQYPVLPDGYHIQTYYAGKRRTFIADATMKHCAIVG